MNLYHCNIKTLEQSLKISIKVNQTHLTRHSQSIKIRQQVKQIIMSMYELTDKPVSKETLHSLLNQKDWHYNVSQ